MWDVKELMDISAIASRIAKSQRIGETKKLNGPSALNNR